MRTFLLCLLVAALAIPNASCAPAVESGSCKNDAGWCSTGAVLTLSGSDLGEGELTIGYDSVQKAAIICSQSSGRSDTQITCTLQPGKYVGEFPVYIGETYVGNVLIGEFYERKPADFELWNKNGVQTEYRVSSISTDSISAAGSWTIYGNFDPSSDYEILFFNTQSELAETSPQLPECTKVSVTRKQSAEASVNSPSNALLCESVTIKVGSMGMYGVLVRDTKTKQYLPGASNLWTVTVQFPTITVEASGDCATKSSKCINSTTLTLTGANLNTRKPPTEKFKHFVLVRVGFDSGAEDRKNITCKVTETNSSTDPTKNSVTCSLTIGDQVAKGLYPVYVINQLCYSGMTATPVHVGNILFGEFLEFDPAGWTPAQLPQQNFSVVGITPSSGTEFTIYGVFNTSATYAVQFYNVQDGMVSGSPGLPTCSSLKISADGTTLSCTAEIKIGMIGMYGFLVRDSDTHWYLNGSTSLSPIAIIPPSPTATGVYSNGELTLTGTNLQTRNKADTFFIEIQIGFGDSGITCVTKSTDYEKGTASCTLNLGNKASKGAYPVFVINYLCNHPMKAPPVLVGGISIKENSAVSWIDVSVPVYLNNYSAIVPTTVRDGEKLHFIGNFSESLQYTVELGENAPTCADAKLISQNILQCTYKGKVGYTSSIEPLVRESSSQAYVSYNTTTISLTSLTVYPPLAVVKAVKGDCVTDAAQCKTGSRLTFTISNAVPAVANNRFLFSPEGPTCTVLSVNGETVECELTVPSGAASSSHAITFQTMANNNAWVEPAVSVGNLVLGVTGGGIQSAVDGMTATTTKEVEKVVTQQNNAAIGAAVAFAILFAIAVVIIICLFVCCSVKRKNKQRNLDFVESNYTAYNTEMSPQPRVD